MILKVHKIVEEIMKYDFKCGHENNDICGEEIKSAISALSNNSAPSLTMAQPDL